MLCPTCGTLGENGREQIIWLFAQLVLTLIGSCWSVWEEGPSFLSHGQDAGVSVGPRGVGRGTQNTKQGLCAYSWQTSWTKTGLFFNAVQPMAVSRHPCVTAYCSTTPWSFSLFSPGGLTGGGHVDSSWGLVLPSSTQKPLGLSPEM